MLGVKVGIMNNRKNYYYSITLLFKLVSLRPRAKRGGSNLKGSPRPAVAGLATLRGLLRSLRFAQSPRNDTLLVSQKSFLDDNGCYNFDMSDFIYKTTFVFSKKGLMRYISHLDLMRLFTRAFRRASLPIKITEGFSPHHKFSIKRALKLGVESDSEEATVLLTELIKPEEFKKRLQIELPEGIDIREII